MSHLQKDAVLGADGGLLRKTIQWQCRKAATAGEGQRVCKVPSSRRSGARQVTTGTREWADHNVNCVTGCYNNCRYCYAKLMAKRFGRKTDDDWKNMEIRNDIVEKDFRLGRHLR